MDEDFYGTDVPEIDVSADIPEPSDPMQDMTDYMSEHNYGMDDYDTYSQDPQYQEINDRLLEADGLDPVDYNANRDPMQDMTDYMNEHNYGREDYDVYSQDPQYQEINDRLLEADGLDPVDYNANRDPMQDMTDYMNEHNYGREDYDTYSQDPEYQAINDRLLEAEGLDPVDYSTVGGGNDVQDSVSDTMDYTGADDAYSDMEPEESVTDVMDDDSIEDADFDDETEESISDIMDNSDANESDFGSDTQDIPDEESDGGITEDTEFESDVQDAYEEVDDTAFEETDFEADAPDTFDDEAGDALADESDFEPDTQDAPDIEADESTEDNPDFYGDAPEPFYGDASDGKIDDTDFSDEAGEPDFNEFDDDPWDLSEADIESDSWDASESGEAEQDLSDDEFEADAEADITNENDVDPDITDAVDTEEPLPDEITDDNADFNNYEGDETEPLPDETDDVSDVVESEEPITDADWDNYLDHDVNNDGVTDGSDEMLIEYAAQEAGDTPEEALAGDNITENTDPFAGDTETSEDTATDAEGEVDGDFTDSAGTVEVNDTEPEISGGEEFSEDVEIPGNFSGFYDSESNRDFEDMVKLDNPDFYESGSFYTQGINEFGFEGTCGPTSQANALNELFGTNEFTENKVLNIAVGNGICETGSLDPADNGGTTTDDFMELYDKVNEQIGDKINVERFDYKNALSVEQMAKELDDGAVLNVAVDSATLWGEKVPGLFFGKKDTDHWITVTGVDRNSDGSIAGFNIIDSGGGESYADVRKYQKMCFGRFGRKMRDPTCIVVTKKNENI